MICRLCSTIAIVEAIELPAPGLQRLLEIGDRRVVLRVGEADGFDADGVGRRP